MELGIGCIIREMRLNLVFDLRQIQVRLDHDSSKTTEIYSHVVNRSLINIKDLVS